MVRHEGSCRRASRNIVKHGRFHLEISLFVKIVSDFFKHLRAFHESGFHVGIDDKVDVTLAVTQIRVSKSVKFFGKGQQGLGQQFYRRNVYGDFAHMRGKNVARNADYIADIVFFEIRISLVAQNVAFKVKLYLPFAV